MKKIIDTKKILFNSLLLIAVIVIITECANPIPLKGGPRDIAPPQVLYCVPTNYSSGFTTDKIYIYFDEFIKLNEVNSQVIISPPLENMPDFKTKGKSVVIKFDEKLKDSTTYTIFFGDAIADITENNPVSNFEYVFSTGPTVDSLSITGEVLNAFTLKPEEDIFVMLYIDNNDTIPFDSMPYLIKPYYVSKTNSNGEFELNNLKNETYKIFALRDANGNYLYDMPNEEIAFSDSLLIPDYYYFPVFDSLIADSLTEEAILNDSLKIDTINNNLYKLFLFQEIDSTQQLTKAALIRKGQLSFIFKFPVKNLNIKVLNHQFDKDWKIEEINPEKDTVIYWLKDVDIDTLVFKITDDTLVLDTVEIAIVKPDRGKRLKKGKEKPQKIQIKSNVKANVLDINMPLNIKFTYPVINYDFSKVLLVEGEDTIVSPQITFKDSIKREAQISRQWSENTNYQLFIPDSVFTDLQNYSNDTTIINFRTKMLTDYGILFLNIKIDNPNKHYIIQLLNENEDVLNERFITENQLIKYEYLNPGKYLIKAILDTNNNGRWDTGDYINNIQPEKTYYFPTDINIRANWDIEEEWELQ